MRNCEITSVNRTRQHLPLAFFRLRAHGIARASRATRVSVALVFVDRRTMVRLSGTYRGKRKASNVLAFPYGDLRTAPQTIAGDIVLCVPVAAAEAKREGISTRTRLARLMLHGMVHLAGYTHDTEKTAKRMEKAEKRAIQKTNFR